jgi:polyisoprenoid-binding protein YceI
MRFGPATAQLTVHTRREGVAAAAGHDLTLLVTDWEATFDLAAEPAVTLRADPRSLEVRDAHGGAKPLSDKDRRDIRATTAGKVLGGTPITFRSTTVEETGPGRHRVAGELTLAGTTRPATWELERSADGTVTAHAELVQSRFGIRPYSAFLGTLKVRDEVEVRFSGSAAA